MNTRLMALDYIKRASTCSSKLQKFMDVSADLSKKRGPALYGYEAELRPASDIFSRMDAEEALVSAEEVFNACNKLINEIFGDIK